MESSNNAGKHTEAKGGERRAGNGRTDKQQTAGGWLGKKEAAAQRQRSRHMEHGGRKGRIGEEMMIANHLRTPAASSPHLHHRIEAA